MTINIQDVIYKPEFQPHKERAIELVSSVYPPLKWWQGSWATDVKVEAVALLLYTGAIGGGAAPDARVAELEAKLKQIAEIAG